MFAFEKCHAHQWHNKRLILHYLIPTRIILGHFPSMELLEKYQLAPPYVNLINTIRSGNIHGFLDHLETYFDYFYQRLTYLLLKERGIVLVWRCLLKNAYAMQQKIGIVTGPKLGFDTMLRAFVLSSQGDEAYECDDLECIVVSLVNQVSRLHHAMKSNRCRHTLIDLVTCKSGLYSWLYTSSTPIPRV